MPSDRRTILQLLANGRIDAAQAERMLFLVSEELETLWALAGCAAVAAVTQLHGLVPELVNLCRAALAGSLPALLHAFPTISFLSGGRL
jgi:hypothetical protein